MSLALGCHVLGYPHSVLELPFFIQKLDTYAHTLPFLRMRAYGAHKQ
jgi:hypothetical protein